MKRFGNKTWRPSKPKDRFKPTREQVQAAVDEYLRRGGAITKIEVLPESKEYRDWQAIHEFLNGN